MQSPPYLAVVPDHLEGLHQFFTGLERRVELSEQRQRGGVLPQRRALVRVNVGLTVQFEETRDVGAPRAS